MITKSHSTAAAIIALTGAAVFLPSAADAAIVYTDGDLILGFRASGGQGSSTNYLVNLGNAASILNSTGVIQFNLGAIGVDLGNIYGLTWFDRADVFWSVSGVQKIAGNGFPNNAMFVTRGDDVDGPLGTNTTTPWPGVSSFGAGAPALKIQSLGTKYGVGTTGSTAADQMESVIAPGALIQPTSQSNNYASFQIGGANSTPGTAYGQFADANGIEDNFALGTSSAVLDAYKVIPGGGPGVFAGNFTINDAAQVTFTGVPEPTTAIALALGGTVLVSLRRRRSSKHAS